MKLTVLLVEDDKLFATIHAEALRDLGYTVLFAEDGEDGVKKAQTENPNVIVLDIGLPKKDGFEVLKELKASDETSSIPVIMYSRLSAREDVNQALALGASEYLIKSQHTPEDLAEHVQRFASLRAGFSSVQRVLLFGTLCVLLGITFYQYLVFRDRSYDADTLLAAERARQAFLAAAQEQSMLVCDSGSALSACRVCTGGDCTAGDQTQTVLHSEWFGSGEACTENSTAPCALSVEWVAGKEGDLRQARIRFYQRRSRDGRAGGRTYVLGPAGISL